MYSSLLIASCLVIVSSAAPKRIPWRRLINPVREEAGKVNHKIKFPSSKELDVEWQSFKSNYSKTYDEEEEEMIRSKIFAKRFKAIIKHNYLYEKGLKSFTMGINEFSDMEHSEFEEMMTGYEPDDLSETVSGSAFFTPVLKNVDLPSEVDWRKEGAVTKVKKQGACRSCWAFSAVGSLEGQHFLKKGKLVSLSAQQLVDCSDGFGPKTFPDLGCKGGAPRYAFDYIKSIQGLETDKSYPYTAEEGECQYRQALAKATCRGYKRIAKGSESKLQEAVATIGPVSVSIDASQPSFKDYATGVYNEPKCRNTNLTHGVLVVGYGTAANGGDYWIVKNSKGTTWGMDGYIWMSRNKNNQCGIATNALYPVI